VPDRADQFRIVRELAASKPIRSTAKITLIEGSKLNKIQTWDPPAGQYSNRVSSITAENVALLKRKPSSISRKPAPVGGRFQTATSRLMCAVIFRNWCVGADGLLAHAGD